MQSAICLVSRLIARRRTASAAVLALVGAGAASAATPAGTVISNIAHIDYRLAGSAAGIASNRVDIRVGEIIDLSVVPAPLCGSAVAANGEIAIGFRITNLGNGREAFIPGPARVTGGSDFVITGIVADSNGNGCYDPGIDQPIPDGGATPILDPGGSIVVFVIGTGGNGRGGVVLNVRSATGTGATGTAVLGGGDGGGDAVIGSSGGAVVNVPAPLPTPLGATLVKTQSVRAPDGSASPRQGAVVTYRIEGSFTGTGIATDAAIADAIPAGTTYVPGSLVLDGKSVSDAADGDAGDFDGGRVSVALGNVVAPAVRSISFQVKIK